MPICLLLPVVLLVILLPVLIPWMTDWAEPAVRRSYSACDYGSGGGSINFCENEIWWRGVVYGVAASTFWAWLVSQLVIWALRIRWRSPLYGVAFFYGASFVLLHLLSIFSGPGQRMSEIWTKAIIVIVLGLGFPVSWFNFRQYGAIIQL